MLPPSPPDDDTLTALITRVRDLDRDYTELVELFPALSDPDRERAMKQGASMARELKELAPKLADALTGLQQQRAVVVRAIDTLIEVADHNVATHMNNGGRGVYKAQARDLRALRTLLAALDGHDESGDESARGTTP